jgi:hypothetical protein
MTSREQSDCGERDNPIPARTLQRRNQWLLRLLRWHWISSALALPALLLFTVTGITLNHSADIPSSHRVTELAGVLPAFQLAELRELSAAESPVMPLVLRDWLGQALDSSPGHGQPEWSARELYIAFPRPGGDAWLSVDLGSGELIYEETDRGWIAWANDLHKGRNTGVWWVGFIDVFAGISLVFCLTGFGILWIHARERASVWPVAGLGLLVPVLLAVLTIH